MFLRLLRSILIGFGLALFAAIVFLAALWAYLELWGRMHPGIGAV